MYCLQPISLAGPASTKTGKKGPQLELSKVFVGRQPIISRNNRIFGYELLFRKSTGSDADVTNNFKATATVIVNSLNDIGLKNIIGDKKGFINTDEELLESGVIDLLPKETIVLEVLETVEFTTDVIDLCKRIRRQGFRLALDDFVYAEPVSPVVKAVNYVKVDLPMYDKQSLCHVVNDLKKYPLKLLAEKVETREDFDHCFSLGFDFFQGYFFAKPAVVAARSLSPAKQVLIELSRYLSKEVEFSIIEDVFKRNPELDYMLLRFINSAAFYTAQKISSIRQALALLGYRNLQKWTTLLLFAGEGRDFQSNPLLERAALRGRIMEVLAKEITKDTATADSAFMVGTLSLVDALFQIRINDLLDEFYLSREIYDALIHRSGLLGTLIRVTEMLEQENFGFIKEALAQYGLSLDDLFLIERDAIIEYETTNSWRL